MTDRPTLGELYKKYGQGLPPPPAEQGAVPDEEWEDAKAAWVKGVGRILMMRYQQDEQTNREADAGSQGTKSIK